MSAIKLRQAAKVAPAGTKNEFLFKEISPSMAIHQLRDDRRAGTS
jgi:hypothetical protein